MLYVFIMNKNPSEVPVNVRKQDFVISAHSVFAHFVHFVSLFIIKDFRAGLFHNVVVVCCFKRAKISSV